MLPFLKPKRMSGVIMATMKPKGEVDDEGYEDEPNMGYIAAAEEIMRAMANKDAHEMAEALKAFVQMCDAEPHVEGEHK